MKISSVLSFFRLLCCFQPFSSTALYIEDVEIAGDIEIIGNDFLSQDAAKGSRQANVDSSFVSFVQTRARGDEIAGLFGLSPSTSQKKHSLPVTSVFHTTQEHVDFDAHSNYQAPVEGLVALYSLEDHEAAHFNVEETCIPIKKNRLMLFKGGDSVHRTVIRNAEKNAVKFIGPFSTRTLSAVGAVSLSPTEYPTSDPTEYPTLNPTASPTSSSTPSPTAIASAATTTISPTTSPTTKSGKTSKSEKTSKSGKTPKSGKKNQLF